MKSTKYTRRKFVCTSAAMSAAAPTLLSINLSHAKDLGKPALLGGEKAVAEQAPPWPIVQKLDEDKFLETLRSTGWCRLGNNVTTEFEKAWSSDLGVNHAIGMVNGTSALYSALYALGVGPGDEVIVPAYTFVASVNAILQQFALPVFADTDRQTFQIDVTTLEDRITEHTRCIMPVHLGGNTADMDEVLRIAAKHKIPVVEDACQAHFAEWRGRRVGGLGDAGCFSFQETKILPCGEGGACVTNSDDLYDKIHAFQNNGRDRKLGKPSEGYLHHGANLRMTEYQSALLLAQLTRLEEQCRHREENAHYLEELLKEIPGVRHAARYEGNTRNTYYLFMMHYDKSQFDDLPRSRFIEALRKEGVYVGGGYHYLNKHPFVEKMLHSRWYSNIYSKERIERYWKNNHCPENDKLSEEGLFMSQRHLLGSKSHVEQIAAAIRKVHAYAKALKA
ncbi:MAG: DegT/DnrJ/EryC1/StrS family aminotransferase [Candidatus Omnitrophica bacterium]|nr:DegT/DnrJ/EryC1/StrS family aminotransferase [Candidatus Omnitrophota bacterium]